MYFTIKYLFINPNKHQGQLRYQIKYLFTDNSTNRFDDLLFNIF